MSRHVSILESNYFPKTRFLPTSFHSTSAPAGPPFVLTFPSFLLQGPSVLVVTRPAPPPHLSASEELRQEVPSLMDLPEAPLPVDRISHSRSAPASPHINFSNDLKSRPGQKNKNVFSDLFFRRPWHTTSRTPSSQPPPMKKRVSNENAPFSGGGCFFNIFPSLPPRPAPTGKVNPRNRSYAAAALFGRVRIG